MNLDTFHHAVTSIGKKAQPVRNHRFMCQCPAHDSARQGQNAQFKQQADGKISFRCFSRGCDMDAALSAIGLTWDDVYPQPLAKPDKSRPRIVSDLDDDFLIIQIARADRQAGKRLSDRDKRAEFAAFQRLKKRGVEIPEGTPVPDEIQFEAYLRGFRCEP